LFRWVYRLVEQLKYNVNVLLTIESLKLLMKCGYKVSCTTCVPEYSPRAASHMQGPHHHSALKPRRLHFARVVRIIIASKFALSTRTLMLSVYSHLMCGNMRAASPKT
jgi:hypothetical protein